MFVRGCNPVGYLTGVLVVSVVRGCNLLPCYQRPVPNSCDVDKPCLDKCSSLAVGASNLHRLRFSLSYGVNPVFTVLFDGNDWSFAWSRSWERLKSWSNVIVGVMERPPCYTVYYCRRGYTFVERTRINILKKWKGDLDHSPAPMSKTVVWDEEILSCCSGKLLCWSDGFSLKFSNTTPHVSLQWLAANPGPNRDGFRSGRSQRSSLSLKVAGLPRVGGCRSMQCKLR